MADRVKVRDVTRGSVVDGWPGFPDTEIVIGLHLVDGAYDVELQVRADVWAADPDGVVRDVLDRLDRVETGEDLDDGWVRCTCGCGGWQVQLRSIELPPLEVA